MTKRDLLIPFAAMLLACGIFGAYVLGDTFARKQTESTRSGLVATVDEKRHGGVTISNVPEDKYTPEKVKQNFKPEDILNFTNEYRVQNGLGLLVANYALNEAACAKAQHMIDNNYWAHIAPDGTEPWFFFNQYGYNYLKAGENLAYGMKDGRSVVDGWIKSEKHRANLLGDFVELGTCTLIGQNYVDDGQQEVTVSFYGQ